MGNQFRLSDAFLTYLSANPPVIPWAVFKVYKMERKLSGKGDISFLEHVFHRLLLNFNWWLNKMDPDGNDTFKGGFLGLDNISVFNRSDPLPDGGAAALACSCSWPRAPAYMAGIYRRTGAEAPWAALPIGQHCIPMTAWALLCFDS